MTKHRQWGFGLVVLCVALMARAALANPTIVVDAASGRVLHEEQATRPWYPASLSKLMTVYTVFKAIKAGRVDGGTPVAISPTAAAQAPSKMGYPIGTLITIDDALKILMVKSANDIAVALAEGTTGSLEAFTAEMNAHSKALGMSQSHWVNPHGLPDPRQVSSARDMAILARAILTEFPEHASLFRIHALRAGQSVLRNHNSLVYRYPGGDGMKTGFICASGYNVVASAQRGNQRLIAVVLGATSAHQRSEKAAQLFEANFNRTGTVAVNDMPPMPGAPADIRASVCGKGRGGGGIPVPAGMVLGEVASQGADGKTVYTLVYQPKKMRVKKGKGKKKPPAPVVQQTVTAVPATGPLQTSWSLDPPLPVGPYVGTRQPAFVPVELVAFAAGRAATGPVKANSFAEAGSAEGQAKTPQAKTPQVNPLAAMPGKPVPSGPQKSKPEAKPKTAAPQPKPKPKPKLQSPEQPAPPPAKKIPAKKKPKQQV